MNTNNSNEKMNITEMQQEIRDLKRSLKEQQVSNIKKKSFFADGFSIEETRASSLIMAMFIILIMACIQMYLKLDISDNIAGILKFALTAVAGASSSVAISNAISNNRNNNNNEGGY